MSRATINRILAVVFAVVATGTALVTTLHAQGKPMPPLRYVVVHKPGPAWQKGVPPFEQPGLQEHVKHFAMLVQQGKLEMGGPFMDEASGGMMIPVPGVTEEEIRAFAAADPTVKSGLLVFEIRPWMAALHP